MKCPVCIRRCELWEGVAGFCGGYVLEHGEIKNAAYGRVFFQREDLHDLPLYSWRGVSECIAFAANGCPARCVHCTNAEYAYRPFSTDARMLIWTPSQLVGVAKSCGCALATDFVEPANIYHYVLDVFNEARQRGVSTILGTAGLFTEEALRPLLEVTDVVRLDIKGWTKRALEKQGFAFSENAALVTALAAVQMGCVLEVTVCLIPGVNDSPEDLHSMSLWIAENLGVDTPVTLLEHWKGNVKDAFPVTTRAQLKTTQEILSGGLHRVYVAEVATNV